MNDRVEIQAHLEYLENGIPVWAWSVPEYGLVLTISIDPPADAIDHPVERVAVIEQILSNMVQPHLIDDMNDLAAEELDQRLPSLSEMSEQLADYSPEEVQAMLNVISGNTKGDDQ
jgi:hypothetical protein